MFAKVLTYIQKSQPNHVNDVQLKPSLQCRTELSTHDGCLLWGNYVYCDHITTELDNGTTRTSWNTPWCYLDKKFS